MSDFVYSFFDRVLSNAALSTAINLKINFTSDSIQQQLTILQFKQYLQSLCSSVQIIFAQEIQNKGVKMIQTSGNLKTKESFQQFFASFLIENELIAAINFTMQPRK
ncbi:Hypothetical_protein [Hexamita inflata]|uniref:Hypothetical_protein n=1 Tax=Hexamita inflata TaxID=28002 RepID=A0AA86RJ96_9EUKA|nr:Hypothetical protein HINF_LOCUS65277 [Hexamita inflata]